MANSGHRSKHNHTINFYNRRKMIFILHTFDQWLGEWRIGKSILNSVTNSNYMFDQFFFFSRIRTNIDFSSIVSSNNWILVNYIRMNNTTCEEAIFKNYFKSKSNDSSSGKSPPSLPILLTRPCSPTLPPALFSVLYSRRLFAAPASFLLLEFQRMAKRNSTFHPKGN